MQLFLDSSALAKRYISEAGSDRVNQLCKSADGITISIVSIVEILSVFNRLKREKRISQKLYRVLKNSFLNDIVDATLTGLNEEVTQKAVLFLERAPLKTLDAIILASAAKSRVDLFISSDKQQMTAAKKLRIVCSLV